MQIHALAHPMPVALIASMLLAAGAIGGDDRPSKSPPDRALGLWQSLVTSTSAGIDEAARTLNSVDWRIDADRIEAFGESFRRELLELIADSGVYAEPSYGVSFIRDDDRRMPIEALPDVPERVVLLVHGLDDPGWMFDDLIPALRAGGYVAARFEYPNDGPISEAADLLAANLRELRAAGVGRVDIVAHSMGGLVARDVLTRPAYYDCDGAGSDLYPAVDRLVMVGTPNHGSHFARVRFLTEAREQVVRAVGGWQGFDRSLVDGGGEAAVDLLPGSTYLRRLNGRPLPAHTRCCIIAGRLSPIDTRAFERWTLETLSFATGSHAPDWLRAFARDDVAGGIRDIVSSTSSMLGDGVVDLDSARLEGVDDFTIVPGNHMSILVRMDNETGEPPTIAIILDRLAQRMPGD